MSGPQTETRTSTQVRIDTLGHLLGIGGGEKELRDRDDLTEAERLELVALEDACEENRQRKYQEQRQKRLRPPPMPTVVQPISNSVLASSTRPPRSKIFVFCPARSLAGSAPRSDCDYHSRRLLQNGRLGTKSKAMYLRPTTTQLVCLGVSEPFHSPVEVSAVIVSPRLDWILQGVPIMQFVERTAIQSHLAVGDYDRRIMLGYVIFAIVALAAIYFTSDGSGVTETELSIATVLP